MSNDLKVIKELEKTIGKNLEELPLDEILSDVTNGYALDDGGRVTRLNLDECKLTEIPAIQGLTQLTGLSLYENQLTDISALQSLTQLTELYLNGNQLTDISALQSLTQLTELYLYDNQLIDISALQSLTQLTTLILYENQLTDISALQSLTQLTWLELQNNQLTDISALQSLTQLKNLYLAGNPLETPPMEVAKRGIEAIRNYFKELREAETLLLQAKLLFVGSGEVGKTTLMRTLTEPDFQLKKEDVGKEDSTDGIHIKPWSVTCPLQDDTEPSRELTLHTWDFGGQEIYRSTHQFFLTKRSLYIFVWEARKDEETHPFEYWLNVIKLLSGDSPVMVVMNKADVRGKPIDEAVYTGKFNIKKFLQVSCLTRRGVDDLHHTLREVLGGMPHLKDKLPKSWLDIRDKLREEQKDYINAVRYYKICGAFGLDRERADHLGDYLHDLGALLRFRSDPLLKDTLVLNPEWATEAVYRLIDKDSILENKGRFDYHELETIWDHKKYPGDKHPQLIRLMEKFELCFKLTGTTTYIVPELVPGQRPGIEDTYFQAEDAPRFQYRYEFMPEGVVSRFIARNYHLIRGENFWKNGVELGFEDATALIIGDPPARKLNVWVKGTLQSELLAIIRNDLNHIHSTLNMKKEAKHYKEEVPCRCSACLGSEDPHVFPFDVLKKMSDLGKTLTCFNSYQDVSPAVLLRGYAPPKREETLLLTLMKCSEMLQGKALIVHPEENSRTGFAVQLLKMRGYVVEEQVLWGRSESGENLGELDMKITGPDGKTLGVAEAFNLSYLNRNVIERHLQKIFGYDPHGLPENFILAYVDAKDFAGLWKKYREFIEEVNYRFARTGEVESIETNMAAIKCVRTTHSREGEETVLYHLFIKMEKRAAPVKP